MSRHENMETVLSKFNKGDNNSFKVLFDQFFKSSCAFVNRYIESTEITQDIVQETFINIWNKQGIFTDMVYFKAYLYKSLRNNAFLHIQRSAKGADLDPYLKDDNYDVLHDMILEEVHRQIIDAVAKLPVQRKRIIEMALEGLTQDEIAANMGISVNTVKTQKRKAFAFLRVELGEIFTLLVLFMQPF